MNYSWTFLLSFTHIKVISFKSLRKVSLCLHPAAELSKRRCDSQIWTSVSVDVCLRRRSDEVSLLRHQLLLFYSFRQFALKKWAGSWSSLMFPALWLVQRTEEYLSWRRPFVSVVETAFRPSWTELIKVKVKVFKQTWEAWKRENCCCWLVFSLFDWLKCPEKINFHKLEKIKRQIFTFEKLKTEMY